MRHLVIEVGSAEVCSCFSEKIFDIICFFDDIYIIFGRGDPDQDPHAAKLNGLFGYPFCAFVCIYKLFHAHYVRPEHLTETPGLST